MAELKVWFETGFANGGHNDILDIPDEEINDCDGDEDAIEKLFEEYAREWFFGYCNFGFELKK